MSELENNFGESWFQIFSWVPIYRSESKSVVLSSLLRAIKTKIDHLTIQNLKHTYGKNYMYKTGKSRKWTGFSVLTCFYMSKKKTDYPLEM